MKQGIGRYKLVFISVLLMMLFSSPGYADCQIIAPQAQTLKQPLDISLGLNDIQFKCRLAEARVLSFPLDALQKPSVYTGQDVIITPLASARAAYLLPEGVYQFTLTAESDHISKVSMSLRDLGTFQRDNNLHILTISAFGGFCIALCIYVGILGRSLRNAGFYAYSGYILSAGFFFVLQEGILRIVFPAVHWLHSHQIKAIFAGATVYTALRFITLLLDPKIGFTFANALRAFLRADPDIILIGEMRDKETAHAGIEASLTGHLVLSTLHTNSAPETITRLLDLGLDPVNFSDACVGILAQRLIRTLCSSCKEKHPVSDTDMAFIRRQYGEEYIDELNLPDNLEIYRAKGCDDCGDTGYRGRTGVHELLGMTPALRSLVYKEASVAEMKAQAMQDGMRTLIQDAIYKVIKGDTDLAQVQIVGGD